MLHITNGDAAAGALRCAGIKEEILPWRDVLHEGPVREGLSLEELSRERAAFIAEAGWGCLDTVLEDFRRRDAALRDCDRHAEVVLWFEHDLYDQLQLLQLLDWFSHHPHPRVTLICEQEYVGRLAPARARELFAARRSMTPGQLAEGRKVWRAWRSPEASQIANAVVNELPFLRAAVRRLLEEYPWTTDGLSCLERNILEALRDGPMELPSLFIRIEEEPAFLGDLVLRWHLQRMESEALLERRGPLWGATGKPRGRRVPRWLGGVRIDDNTRWRWDPGTACLVETRKT